jgi:hypothetical protein
MRACSILAASVGLWAAAAEAAQPTAAAEDFDNFEDNLAMESERSFATMNFDDFTSQFPTPDLRKLLAESGLFSSDTSGFGQRMGGADSGGSLSLAAGSNGGGNTTASSFKELSGAVISQLLGGKGQRVEDMHQELSGLLFGNSAAEHVEEKRRSSLLSI